MKTIIELNYFAQGAEGASFAESRAGTDGEARGKADAVAAAADGGKTAGQGAPQEHGGAETTRRPAAAAAQPERAAQEEQESDEALAERARMAARFVARVKAANAVAERWQREAQELQALYPSFSLEEAMRSDRGFVTLLRAGLPMRKAYEAAHLEAIMGAAMRYAADTARRRAAQAIQTGAGRVRENPVLDRAGSINKKDVGSLTDKDILSILRQVSNGKRVTF